MSLTLSVLPIITFSMKLSMSSSFCYIGTLTGMIRAVARHNKEDWDLYLSACEFAYNDSVHAATGFTPFQLANGRDPATPMQLLLHGAVQKPVLYAANEQA